ncbi:unnamed protein product [Amoebophrya sp. A25]|nr:unnamed protein product [Amoebophrya sp. A25]|eukprot:GSA25T00017516001.1
MEQSRVRDAQHFAGVGRGPCRNDNLNVGVGSFLGIENLILTFWYAYGFKREVLCRLLISGCM